MHAREVTREGVSARARVFACWHARERNRSGTRARGCTRDRLHAREGQGARARTCTRARDREKSQRDKCVSCVCACACVLAWVCLYDKGAEYITQKIFSKKCKKSLLIKFFVLPLRCQRITGRPDSREKNNKAMKTFKEFNLQDWAKVAYLHTLRAANIKAWKLTRKHDKQMRIIAQELIKGRGYIIATASELAKTYPGMIDTVGVDSKKMIWGIAVSTSSRGNKLNFIPVR